MINTNTMNRLYTKTFHRRNKKHIHVYYQTIKRQCHAEETMKQETVVDNSTFSCLKQTQRSVTSEMTQGRKIRRERFSQNRMKGYLEHI